MRSHGTSYENLPVVLAVTGASGAVYAVRLLECLLQAGRLVHCVVSPAAETVAQQELGVKGGFSVESLDGLEAACSRLLRPVSLREASGPDSERKASGRVLADGVARGQLIIHHHGDYFVPIASGSYRTAGMIICPCSGSTLAAIAHSAGQNLVHRAAEVHLKERRKLVVVPRETPLSTFQIENMLRLSQAGVVVLPASPGWYHGVECLGDLVDFIVARILDQFGIELHLIQRWGTEPCEVSSTSDGK